jgi:hypothetical protein
MPKSGREEGSAAVLVCFMVLIISLLFGFILDISARIKAATRADTYSAEAARAASIGVGTLPSGGAADTAAAVAAVNSYLASAGVTGVVKVVGPAEVQVSVTVTDTGPISGVAFTVTRTHVAQLQVGVETGEVP